METDQKPFDDRPRAELHRAHAGDDRGIQISQLVGTGNGDHNLHAALGRRHRFEQPLDHLLGVHTLGLGEEIGHDAVA